MIKIIKCGQRDFVANCNVCGCEFSYQTEDIKLSSVACPCCGLNVSLGNFAQFSGNTTKTDKGDNE